MRRPTWLTLAAAVALLAAGCGSDAAGLLVRFHSERVIPDEADALDLRVVGVDDGDEVIARTYDLTPIGAFPVTLGMTRGGATPDRVRIEGVLRLGDAIVAAGAAVSEFVDGANRQVDVTLVE